MRPGIPRVGPALLAIAILVVVAAAARSRPGASASVPEPPTARDQATPGAAACSAVDPTLVELGLGLEGGGIVPGRVYSVSDGTLAVLVTVAAIDAGGAAVALNFLASVRVDAVILGTGGGATALAIEPPAQDGAGLATGDGAAIRQVAFCYRIGAGAMPVAPLPAGAAPRATVAARATANAAAGAATATSAAAAATATAELGFVVATSAARATEVVAAREAADALATAGARTAEARQTADASALAEATAAAQEEATRAAADGTARASAAAQATADASAARATVAAFATRDAGLVATVAAQGTTAAAVAATGTAAAAVGATASAEAANRARVEAVAQETAVARATVEAAAAASATAVEGGRRVAETATSAAREVAALAAANELGTAQAGRDQALAAAQATAAAAQATAASLASAVAVAGQTATALAIPTATPTPVAGGALASPLAVLFPRVDGEQPEAFAGWTLPPGWTVENGTLATAGDGGGAWATPPFRVEGIVNYAVEVEIELVDPAAVGCEGNFGVGARGSDAGYYAAGVDWRCAPSARLWAGQNAIANTALVPAAGWHTYRLEVRGGTVRFLIDGALVLEAVDDRYPSGGEVGLWTNGVQLNVRTFTVTDLPAPP